MTTTTELKACPFCGPKPDSPIGYTANDLVDGFDHFTVIRCVHCGVEVSEEYRTAAIETWNTRTPALDADAVERLRPLLEAKRKKNIPLGAGERLVGFVLSEEDAGLSDGLFMLDALTATARAALASTAPVSSGREEPADDIMTHYMARTSGATYDVRTGLPASTPSSAPEGLVERLEKYAREISIQIGNVIGGGSENFTRIGEEFYIDPAVIVPAIQNKLRVLGKLASLTPNQDEQRIRAEALALRTRDIGWSMQSEEQQARIKELEEGLKPFADALEDCGDDIDLPDRCDLWEHSIAMNITLGDFRRARNLIQKEGGQ